MCSLEKRGKVYILTLVGEGEHKFNPTMFDAISEALKVVEESGDAAAMVTTNEGNHFSSGLDMAWVAESPGDRFDAGMEKLDKMLASFMKLSVPTVAAICGDAIASGFMLALAHDYRIMRRTSELYFCELDSGFPIPESMMALIRSKVNAQTVRDAVLGGKKVRADTALERGVVDGIGKDSSGTLKEAIAVAERLASRGWEREIYRGFRHASFPGVVEALHNRVVYPILPTFNLIRFRET